VRQAKNKLDRLEPSSFSHKREPPPTSAKLRSNMPETGIPWFPRACFISSVKWEYFLDGSKERAIKTAKLSKKMNSQVPALA